MDPSLQSLDQINQITSTALDLAIKFAPRLLVAVLILVAGFYAGRWAGRALLRALSHARLEPPVRALLVRITEVLVLLVFAIMALVTLAGAIAAMRLRHLVHCALCLVMAFVLAVFAARCFGDDLLSEHIERRIVVHDRVQLALADGPKERRTLDEVISRRWEHAPLGDPVDGVTGAADALQQRGDAMRRPDLADQIDMPDVDPELE